MSGNNCFVFIAHAPGGSAGNCRYILSLLVAEKDTATTVYGHLLCSGVEGIGQKLMKYAAEQIHKDPNIHTLRFSPTQQAIPLYKRFGAVEDKKEGYMVKKIREAADMEDMEIYSIVLQCIAALRYMRAKGVKHGKLSAREVSYFKLDEAPLYLNLKTNRVERESSEYTIRLERLIHIDLDSVKSIQIGDDDYEDFLSLFSSLYKFPIVRKIAQDMISKEFEEESRKILNHEITLLLQGRKQDLGSIPESLTKMIEKELYRYCAKKSGAKELDTLEEVHEEIMLRLQIINYETDPDAHLEIWESTKMIDHLTELLKQNRENLLQSLMDIDYMYMSCVLLEEIVGKDWRTRVTQDQDISTFEKIHKLLTNRWPEFNPDDSVYYHLSRTGLEGFKIFFIPDTSRSFRTRLIGS